MWRLFFEGPLVQEGIFLCYLVVTVQILNGHTSVRYSYLSYLNARLIRGSHCSSIGAWKQNRNNSNNSNNTKAVNSKKKQHKTKKQQQKTHRKAAVGDRMLCTRSLFALSLFGLPPRPFPLVSGTQLPIKEYERCSCSHTFRIRPHVMSGHQQGLLTRD
jgi:hypothetical protein